MGTSLSPCLSPVLPQRPVHATSQPLWSALSSQTRALVWRAPRGPVAVAGSQLELSGSSSTPLVSDDRVLWRVDRDRP